MRRCFADVRVLIGYIVELCKNFKWKKMKNLPNRIGCPRAQYFGIQNYVKMFSHICAQIVCKFQNKHQNPCIRISNKINRHNHRVKKVA